MSAATRSAPAIDAHDPARLLPAVPARSWAEHLDRFGPPTERPDLIDQTERAGLRGRGGARFPTARKLATVAAGRRTVVVGNGSEGEPASAKDATLLTRAPHLVLDGAAAAAAAVGAGEVILALHRSRPEVADVVRAALAERAAARVDRVAIRVELIPDRYVAGEESALVHWINGGEAKPTKVPPRPFEKGVGRRPTLVDNVETLAQLALIARWGGDWFRALGTAADPGTFLITVSGDVPRPGVVEVPGGTPIESVLEAVGSSTHSLQALLLGGYFGRWIAAAGADRLTTDAASLATVGASLGSGILVGLGPQTCGIAETTRVARWLAGETAGQCGPCVHGLADIAGWMEHLASGGRRAREAAGQIHRLADMVEGRGVCRYPDGAVRFVTSGVDLFAAHAADHVRRGGCELQSGLLPTPPTGGLAMSLRLVVDPIACDGRGLCAELLGELIVLDDWGYPMIAPGPVPDRLESHARRAVAFCPTLALSLVPEAPVEVRADRRRRAR